MQTNTKTPRIRLLLIEAVLWVLIMFMSAYWAMNAPTPVGKFVSSFNVIITCVMLPYYLTNRIITPKYLIGKKIKLYILFTFLIIVLNPILGFMLNNQLDYLFFGTKRIFTFDLTKRSHYVLLWNTVVALALGTGVHLLMHYFVTEKKILQLEKERVKSELDFLRSQINPHFLFNVMNTLYFLIDKDNINARNSVEDFTKLLRYQLQVGDKDNVPIEQEIEYLITYCNLQRLRLEPETIIDLDISPTIKGFNIEPLLFLPIVENAFKYISHYTPASQNYISIKLHQTVENKIVFAVINSTEEASVYRNKAIESSGVGLTNLRKRLDIYYANNYILDYQKKEHRFEVYLSIKTNN